jgi:hypothetical protein
MHSIEYDETYSPIVIIKVPRRDLTNEEFDTLLDKLSHYNASGRAGFVFDVRDTPPPSADRRRMIAERIDKDAKQYGCLSPSAVVVSSTLWVGIARVLSWLTQSNYENNTFNSVAEALVWLKSVLERDRTKQKR